VATPAIAMPGTTISMRVAINGAGIAGPTLAYWLCRSGHEVLLVEQAPRPRRGGYVVDFWGIGYDVAETMGLLPRIGELGYQVHEVRFVDGHGRRLGVLRGGRAAPHHRWPHDEPAPLRPGGGHPRRARRLGGDDVR
jgi:2-polyprenyl-6-methoxyphenol hydroxylase-like FAD-dependent oxidoreductase